MNGYDDFAERYYGQLFDEAMTGKTYFKDDDDLLEDFDDEAEDAV